MVDLPVVAHYQRVLSAPVDDLVQERGRDGSLDGLHRALAVMTMRQRLFISGSGRASERYMQRQDRRHSARWLRQIVEIIEDAGDSRAPRGVGSLPGF